MALTPGTRLGPYKIFSPLGAGDGQRFFVNTVVDQPTRAVLTVILNWTADLKK